MNSLILGSSKGIGKEIYISLKKIGVDVKGTSSKILDTSNIQNVEKFCKNQNSFDILILNTGGPPKKNFFKVSKNDWVKYFNQLFLSFV